jgi:hypothetical protein
MKFSTLLILNHLQNRCYDDYELISRYLNLELSRINHIKVCNTEVEHILGFEVHPLVRSITLRKALSTDNHQQPDRMQLQSGGSFWVGWEFTAGITSYREGLRRS